MAITTKTGINAKDKLAKEIFCTILFMKNRLSLS